MRHLDRMDELLTNTTLNYLKRAFFFSHLLRFHPFEWNRSLNAPRLVSSKYQIFLWYLNVVLTFTYYGFIAYRCVQTNRDPRSSQSEKIYMQFALVYYTFPVLFQASNLINRNNLPVCVARYLRFLRHCQGKRCSFPYFATHHVAFVDRHSFTYSFCRNSAVLL